MKGKSVKSKPVSRRTEILGLLAVVVVSGVLLSIVLVQAERPAQATNAALATSFASTETQNSTVIISPNLSSGPTYYLGCVGNQPVMISTAAHPANTSDVYPGTYANNYAASQHDYCLNGTLINSDSNKIIPFPSPPPATP
jgi:hypothetical protein